jgi:hypothetical protein
VLSPGDSRVDVSDPIATPVDLFVASGAVCCRDAADANDSGDPEVSDAVYCLAFSFRGGPAAPPPFPDRGGDPTAEETDLVCAAPRACE